MDHDRCSSLVNRTRLAIGYCAHMRISLTQEDLETIYNDLCELSELLGIEPIRADELKDPK